MPLVPLLLLCALMLLLPASAGAVPPPAGARFDLPEGALLGLQEEAAALAAWRAAARAARVEPAFPAAAGTASAAAEAAAPGAAGTRVEDAGEPAASPAAEAKAASDTAPDVGAGVETPLATPAAAGLEPALPSPAPDGAAAGAVPTLAVPAPPELPVPSQAADGGLPPPAGVGHPPLVATRVTVPLQLRLPFIRRLLLEQVFTDDGSARFLGDEAGCNELVLSEPALRTEPATATSPALLITTLRAEARIGLALLGSCTGLAQWQGVLEVRQLPSLLAGGGGFALGVVDSELTNAEGNRGGAGTLWNAVKGRVHERMGAVRVDLSEALATLRELLPQLLARQTGEGLAAVIATMRVEDARAEPHGVTVDLHFSAPPAPASPPPARLSAAELERFRQAVSQLDGFLTFVVRTVAGGPLDEDTRSALLEALLDGRYRLLAALVEGVPGDDVVRGLFVDLWSELAPALAGLPGTTPGEEGLRYLAFITAGDALAALEALGPATGLDISADGLRRLARLIAPGEAADPLEAGDAVDETLRRRFGFGSPLPPPRPPAPAEPEEPDVSDEWEQPGPDVRLWLQDWLLRAASAATVAGGADDPHARLQGWVPGVAELPVYLPLVRDLLHAVVQAEQQASEMPQRLHTLYHALVLATAWQESCWRQFVRENGRVVTLRSSAGALGIMQVNKSVWRGFYDVDGLARDMAYNARAGAEIARHYLLDHALRAREDEQPGGIDNLARATYAAYNGGPGQLRRYRLEKTSKRARAVDAAFLAKYETVRGGDELAVASCFGG